MEIFLNTFQKRLTSAVELLRVKKFTLEKI